MKKYLLFFIFIFAISYTWAQETDDETTKDKPVRFPWESGYLIDHQTSLIQPLKTLQFSIQHKFGTFENGSKDLWGVYAPGANVRLGLEYVPYTNVQIGYGITKTQFTHDFNLKWTVFEQTRANTIPVSVTAYGLMAIDAREDEVYGKDYTFNSRFSYFSELIIGRKINNKISVQVSGSFSHYNMVDTATTDYNKVAVHLCGRAKFSPQGAFIFNFDYPLDIDGLTLTRSLENHPKPNLAVGVEFSTSTHAFQIYAGQASGFLPQDNMINQHKEMYLKNFALGFTITRLWSF